MLLSETNQIKAAISAIKKAIQLAPGNTAYRRMYAELLRKQMK